MSRQRLIRSTMESAGTMTRATARAASPGARNIAARPVRIAS